MKILQNSEKDENIYLENCAAKVTTGVPLRVASFKHMEKQANLFGIIRSYKKILQNDILVVVNTYKHVLTTSTESK